MSVTVTNPVAGPYTPNGATVAFGFDFKIASTSEIAVFVGGAEASAATYTVSIAADGEGGTVTFATAPATGAGSIYIVSDPLFTQTTAFSAEGPFSPTTLNTGLDRAAIRDLRLNRMIDGSLRAPVFETLPELPTAANRASKYLAFDASSNPIAMTAPVVTFASGQSVSTRSALASITAPVAGQSATLTEAGREGLFVFSTANLSAKVTSDAAQGIYVAPTSAPTGASGAWVRKYSGMISASWFGALPGIDIAPAMRNILTFASDDGLTVHLPPSNTGYLWNSKVDWNARVDLVSIEHAGVQSAIGEGFNHGALILVPPGVTAIIPQRSPLGYADGCVFKGLAFRATGSNTTSTTGSITDSTFTLTLAAAGDFTNGQIIRVRGGGFDGVFQGNKLRGTTVAGSAVITTNVDPTGVMVGMVAGVGTAFPANAYVVSKTATSVTLSANATATVATPTRIKYTSDYYGYIESGGGTTTLTMNSAPRQVITGGKVEHYDSAIFGFTGFVVDGCAAENFNVGAGFAMLAGGFQKTPNNNSLATNANCYSWRNVSIRTGYNGVLIEGNDANACDFTNVSTVSTTAWGIIDQSFLGNLWNKTHTSGGYGILHVLDTQSRSQFNYAYTEVGTVNSFSAIATGLGYQSGEEDGGNRFIPVNGGLAMPVQQIYPTGYAYGSVTLGARRTDNDGSGIFDLDYSAIGGPNTYRLFDSWKAGYLGLYDGQANKSNLHLSMTGAPTIGAGHTLVNSLYIGDGTEAAQLTLAKYRQHLTGAAAPAAGTFVAGDVVWNNAPVAGGTPGWMCTTSGTPGTWKAMANLAA